MAALWVSRMALEGNTISNRRRSGWCVMPDLGEWRLLAVVLGGHHLRFHAVGAAGWRAVAVVIVVVVIAAIEVSRSFMFICATVLRPV
jgi:hypothetical protein